LLTGIAAAQTDYDSSNVSWKGVIGIIHAGNLVGNILDGGQPWSALGREAQNHRAAPARNARLERTRTARLQAACWA